MLPAIIRLLIREPEEDFCACVWTRDEATKDPLLAVAGGVGVIKVINTRLQKVVANLAGHGDVMLPNS
jgi:hypothetical protein